MKNNKKIKFAVLIFVFTSVLLPANEVSAVWTRLFRKASSLSQKTSVMTNIVEQNSREMIPVLIEALDEQVSELQNQGNTTSRFQTNEYIKMICKELGRLKANEAAPLIWEIVKAVDDPLLKGEAIIALGKAGAINYTENLNASLRNINFNFGDIQAQRNEEIIAFALVIALDRLKQPSSYSPLFFASTGWYSSGSGVRDKASAALLNLVDDPTNELMQILSDSKAYDIKLAALTAGGNSRAGDENIGRLAVLALAEGMQYSPLNIIEKTQLKSLRVKALNILETVTLKPEQALVSMSRMVFLYRTERVIDVDEMVDLFETFGTFTSDDSVNILVDFLAYLTERKQSGAIIDSRIAKSVVMALGNTGNSIGFEELSNVNYSDFWESAIKREAKNAIEKLK